MSRIFNRRVFAAALVLILAAIFVPPLINVSRFKPRIAGALGNALGRNVTIGDVELRLLPAPGLTLHRVVVDDDPAFSQEPMLRADDVTASLRLTSLWRGRLEIARLTFDTPSLNLVRRPDGHWNLESLLERARQTPVAPTTQRIAEQRKRFPYIESNGGRVNLKLGQEKTVWSLADADFALWIEREDEWNLRLAARPIRTDANLGDTGTVKLSGTIRRGPSLRETLLDLRGSVLGAQLGQLTTLIYGRDRGWRGTVNAGVALQGTPASLALKSDASVEDFRRYDITTSGNMRLATSCSAKFTVSSQQFQDVMCHSTVGDGFVDVRGQSAGIAPVRTYQLSMTARDVPAAALAVLARHIKKDLPQDVGAVGSVNGNFNLTRAEGADPVWSGAGVATSVALNSGLMEQPLTIGELHFGLPGVEQVRPAVRKRSLTAPVPTPRALLLDTFRLDLGGTSPAHADGSLGRRGYTFSIRGDAGLKRLLQVSQALGIAAPRFSPTGTATLNLTIAGEWAGFAQPLVMGTATLKATAPVNGIAAPVQVTSAKLTLAPDSITVQDLAFSWPEAHVGFAGSLTMPRRCTTAETCPVDFQLHSDAINSADVVALLSPGKRPWYAIFASGSAVTPVWMRLTASGQLTVASLTVHGVALKNATAKVALKQGAVVVRNFAGAAFGGNLGGTLLADFAATTPKYEVSGKLERASVAAMTAPTEVRRAATDTRSAVPWGTGKLDAAFAFAAAGHELANVLQSATGTVEYAWREGTAPLSLDGVHRPLRILDFRGAASLKDGVLQFAPGKMRTPGGIYMVSGTASLDRKLSLTFSRGELPVYDVSGTLERPQVSTTFDPAASVPSHEARAKLKQ